MIIGKIDNKNVIFSHTDKMVRIEHTNIIIIGIESTKNAIEKCKVNFKGFEEVYPVPAGQCREKVRRI